MARADELLAQLEVSHHQQTRGPSGSPPERAEAQMSLFTEYLPHPALEALGKLDLESLTPDAGLRRAAEDPPAGRGGTQRVG